jgi:NAD-dependent SIR2 family protein deacetylase
MEEKIYCQSCSMPIDDPEFRGTEMDGSKNSEYCKYCYQQGEFVNPGITLDEMKHVMMEKMDNRNIPDSVIQQALKRLPNLKRWVARVEIA